MKEVLPNDPVYYYRHVLWALDIRTGGVIRSTTIAESRHTCPQAGQMCQFVDYISGPSLPQSTADDADADGVLRFQVLRHLQRCGLELYNGIVVVAFAGYDGALPPRGVGKAACLPDDSIVIAAFRRTQRCCMGCSKPAFAQQLALPPVSLHANLNLHVHCRHLALARLGAWLRRRLLRAVLRLQRRAQRRRGWHLGACSCPFELCDIVNTHGRVRVADGSGVTNVDDGLCSALLSCRVPATSCRLMRTASCTCLRATATSTRTHPTSTPMASPLMVRNCAMPDCR